MKELLVLRDWLALDYAIFGEPVTYESFAFDIVEDWSNAKNLYLEAKYGSKTVKNAKKLVSKPKAVKAVVSAAKKAAAKARKKAKAKIAVKKKRVKEQVLSMAKQIMRESYISSVDAANKATQIALAEYVLREFNTGLVTGDMLACVIKDTL
jgi:hypothetical protein